MRQVRYNKTETCSNQQILEMEMDSQSNDFKWFENNRIELFAKYGDVFLAIKNRQVLGVYQSYAEGVKKTSQKEVLGTFIVQHCTQDRSGYTDYIYSTNY